MNTIVVDCGASFIKGALISKGKILKKIEKPSIVVHGEESILCVNQISALLPVVKEIILNLGADEKEVKLCISNEMHGFLLTDSYGVPFTDYISWQKEYGNIKINEISSLEILLKQEANLNIANSGMKLRAGLPSCNLFYLYRSGILSKGQKFYTLGDYIIRSLSGIEPYCHVTNAAATGLYDIIKNDWNFSLIEFICKNQIIFPKIGEKEITFCLNDLKIHCFPAIGDQQAALLGAGLSDEKTLSFNIGTGSQVSCLISQIELSKQYQVRPYFFHRYLKTIPHLPSGRALNVYIRFFKDVLALYNFYPSNDDLWEKLLNIPDSSFSKLDCDMSFFENPVTNYTTGAIKNIEEYSLTPGNLMNSAILKLINNYLWAAKIIFPNTEDIKKIIFSGGMARKIQQISLNIKDHYGENIEYFISENETLQGLYFYGNLMDKNEK